MGGYILRINIVCVGNIKEKFYSAACSEYIKRLSKYHTVEITEVEKLKQNQNNIADIFEDVIKKEEETTENIYKLYEITKNANDYTTLLFLQ